MRTMCSRYPDRRCGRAPLTRRTAAWGERLGVRTAEPLLAVYSSWASRGVTIPPCVVMCMQSTCR